MDKAASILSSIIGGGRRSGEPSGTVTSVVVYPIKSCRGISVARAPITSTGFRWDRNWLVVNAKGRAYTQRVEPKLALVEVELPTDAFNEDWEPTDNSFLVLRAPGMELLRIPLNRSCNVIDGVSVWEWFGSAFDEGTEASEWFSSYLGKPCRLVRFNSTSQIRPVDESYAPGYKVTFSDGYPFLAISQGSLNMLNELLPEPLLMNRFRPNIVVDGVEPFSEDLWKVIKISKFTFHGVKLCSRCKMPTINQESGISGVEPTETLVKHRSDRVLNLRKQKGLVFFGQNLVCKDSLSLPTTGRSIEVGDPIFVLEKLSSITDASF